VPFGEGGIGRVVQKQTDGRLIQIAGILLEANDGIPASLLQQFEYGALGVERIQQQDVEKLAAIESRQSPQQAERRSFLPFSAA